MIIYVTCKDMERTTTGTGREDELEEGGREGRQKEREKENLSREKLEIDKASLKQQTHKIEAKQRIVAEILPIVKVFCTINT